MSQTLEDITTAATKWQPYDAYKASGVAWLGEIPEHWEVKRLKFVAPISKIKLLDRPEELPYIGLEHVESRTGRLLLDVPVENVESTVAVFYAGDILFGKLRPYLAKVAYVDFQGVCTTELLVLQPDESMEAQFLFYRLLSEDFIELINSMTYGTKMPRASSEQIGDTAIQLPPLPEQRAIAAFLDHETASINALIAKKEQLITLLRERRTALISHAVTKGLDPAVPMKDSGVAWLGEIPRHWEVHQLRRVIDTFVDYRGFTPTKTPSGVPLVTARNIKNGMIDFTLSQEFISEEDYPDRMVRGFPRIGDVLVTTEAPLGETAQIVDEKIALAQRIILLKVNRLLITNDYLKHYFESKSGKAELWCRATGSTAVGIKASHLREIFVTVPPIVEQNAIVEYIIKETTQIDALIARIEEGKKKLQEYSTALISAAVTGKIDVRGM